MTSKESKSISSKDNSQQKIGNSANSTADMPSGLGLVGLYAPLIPSVLGLCFARAGLIVAGYGSYSRTDDGIYTDGAMLAALALMGIVLVVFTVGKVRLKKPVTNAVMRTCVVLETACIAVLPALKHAGLLSSSLHYFVCVAVTFFASFAIFYWLRRARGCGSTTAVLYVFSALAISEVEIYICSLTAEAGFYLAAALSLLQLPLMLSARKNKLANDIDSFTPHDDYFGFAKSALSSKRFLSATAIGVGFLSVVIGFLRGYPDGLPIAFQPGTRVAYGLLTIVICIALIFLVLSKKRRVMTVGIFIVMELLACTALVLYAAFPDMLDIGAVPSTTLNALMVGFTWYIIIAFMSFGWRDPYYYALAGWIVWLGCRAIARVTLMNMQFLSVNDVLINAVMGAGVVISTQVALGQFLNVSQIEADERSERYEKKLENLEQQLANAQANVETMAHLGVNEPVYAGCEICAAADGRALLQPENSLHCAGVVAGAAAEGGSAAGAPATVTMAARLRGGAPSGNGLITGSTAADEGAELNRGMRLARLMGLDEGDSVIDIRKATMQHNAELIGKQFLLSDREVEVLALYAMGWTQKRVAEELYISPSTAHAHIKRIYAKTGLHSRQEILDYMDQYAE